MTASGRTMGRASHFQLRAQGRFSERRRRLSVGGRARETRAGQVSDPQSSRSSRSGQMLLIWLFTSPAHQAWLWRGRPAHLDRWRRRDPVRRPFHRRSHRRRTDVGVSTGQEAENSQPAKRIKRIHSSQRGSSATVATRTICVKWPCGGCSICSPSQRPNQWLHWTGLGCILLTLLFVGSIRLGESISLEQISCLWRLSGQHAMRSSPARPPQKGDRLIVRWSNRVAALAGERVNAPRRDIFEKGSTT